MFNIKVPATSANLGSGFDCIGMSLSLFNYIKVEESDKPLEIILTKENDSIPKDEENLIYSTMVKFYDITGKGKVPNIKITQDDNIPLTRGLGSSAACIVGGILAADRLSKANLSKDELAYIAAKIEGHPDNSTPAIMGGVVVGALSENKLDYIKLDIKNVDRLNFAVMIPNFQLSTEKARNILPSSYNIKDVVFNVSRAALLVASLSSGKFDCLETAMDDRLHQPYRKNIINNMEEIIFHSKKFGAKATFLSGAGPTLIAVTTDLDFFDNMKNYLNKIDGGWDLQNIKLDLAGAEIF